MPPELFKGVTLCIGDKGVPMSPIQELSIESKDEVIYAWQVQGAGEVTIDTAYTRQVAERRERLKEYWDMLNV